MENDPSNPSFNAQERIDALCDAFEGQWLAGNVPDIEAYLGLAPPNHRSCLLRELIVLEWDYRQRGGDRVQIDTYVDSYPDDADSIRELFERFSDRGQGSVEVTIDSTPPAALDSDTVNHTGDSSVDESPTPAHQSVYNLGGERIGGYELESMIGRGGMGVVYRARQLNLNRTVALKMIKPGEFDDPSYIRRFQAEAEAAAKIDHPGIVQVYDVGCEEGRHFFSMAFIDGENLAELVADQPLENRQAAELTRAIAEAITMAHSVGLIHRDLKPANVLIDSTGHPKITDFGLAKSIRADSDLTATGQIVGTPSFMPPEQATGELENVRETADIYSIGAILYNLLTGIPPFKAANPFDTIKQLLEQEPVAPRKLNSQISPDLETICLKCLEKEPAARYQSAKELVDDFTRYLRGEPIHARPIGPLGRTSRWARRQPVVAGLIVAVAVSLLAGTGFTAYYSVEASRRAQQAESNLLAANWQKNRADDKAEIASKRSQEAERLRKLAEDAKGRVEDALKQQEAANKEAREALRKAEEEKNRAEDLLYSSTIALAHRDWLARDPISARTILSSTAPKRRGWEFNYLNHLFNGNNRVAGRSIHTPLISFYSANGKSFFSVDNRELVRVDLATDEEQLRWTLPAEVTSYDVNVVTGRLALATGGIVVICDGNTGKRIRSLFIDGANVQNVAYRPDGKHLAATVTRSDGSSQLVIWNPETSDEVENLALPVTGIGPLDYRADGKQLIVGAEKILLLFDEAYKQTNKIQRNVVGTPRQLELHPSGKKVFIRHGAIAVRYFEGREFYPFEERESIIGDMAMSPDGTVLATTDYKVIRLFNAENHRQIEVMPGHSGDIRSLAFHPDGSEILATGNGKRMSSEIRIYRPSPNRPADMFFPGRVSVNNGILGVAVNRDGSQVATALHAYGGVSGFIVRDAATMDRSFMATTRESFTHNVAFHPTKDLLLVPMGKPGTKQTIGLWNSVTGELEIECEEIAFKQCCVLFHPEGRIFATGGFKGGVIIWDAASGKKLRQLSGPDSVRALRFSPDGKLLAASQATSDGYQGLFFWNTDSWEEIKGDAVTDGSIHDIAFSADGKSIYLACYEHIKQIDVASRTRIRNLTGHWGFVNALAITPDGTRLASGADDGKILLWDTDNGQQVLTLRGSDDAVYDLAFSPDGSVLYCGNQRDLTFWHATAEK